MLEQRKSICAKGLVALAAICAACVAQAQTPGHWVELGAGDHIEIDTGEISLPTTVEMWVRPMSDDIISPVGGHPDHAELHFYRHSDGYFYAFQTGPPDDDRTQIAGSPVATDEWHHIALVVSPDGRSLYVNGDLQAEDDFEVFPHRFVTIGAREDGQYSWIGGVNDVRVWDTARSQAEIQDNMDALLRGSEEGLIHYWPMNEGSGDTIEDTVGGISGTAVGNLVWQGEHPFVEAGTESFLRLEPGESAELGPVLLWEEYEGDATFQWYFNGEELEGETGNGLLLDNPTGDDDGVYTVVVNHPDFDDPIVEFETTVRVFEAQAPAASALGLGALAGTLALLGGVRRKRQ